MGRASRTKGANGEREWAAFLREAGFTDAHRGGQLYQRGSTVADVEGLPFIHVEVKRQERLNLRAAMEQSMRDAADEGRGRLPIVAHRTNRKPWLVTMEGKDWIRLFKAALRGAKQRGA
jgi:Holliday junction resolvase